MTSLKRALVYLKRNILRSIVLFAVIAVAVFVLE